jgi:hypothetical protein
VAAAGEPPGFVSPHSRRRSRGWTVGFSLARLTSLGRAAEAGGEGFARVLAESLKVKGARPGLGRPICVSSRYTTDPSGLIVMVFWWFFFFLKNIQI